MIGRLGKKWPMRLFIALLFSVLLAGYGCVNSEAYLLSKHNAITIEQWGKYRRMNWRMLWKKANLIRTS